MNGAHAISCDLPPDCSCGNADYLYSADSLFGRGRVVGFGTTGFVVKPIPKEMADETIRAHHYSRAVVWSSSVHLGLFVDGAFLGALQFGPLMNPASAGKIVAGATHDTALELNRMWLSPDAPRQSASRVLSFACKLVRRLKPSIEFVQSFADERCGKWGAVYQSASFLYLGSHVSTFIELDGEWFHKSMLGRKEYDKRGWWQGPKVGRLRDGLARAVFYEFRQFRYLKPLNRSVRKRLLMPVQPYPKPDGGEAA